MGNTQENKLTVAHFIPWFGMGGVEIATLRLAIATRELFNNIAFFIPEAVELKKTFEDAGIETRFYNPPEPSLRHAAKYYRDSQTVMRQIQSVGADIVHFSDFEAAYRNSLATKLAGVRTICHVRLSMPQLSFRLRLGAKPVKHYIFVSKEAKDTFAIPLKGDQARVVYDAVEVPEDLPSVDTRAVREEFGIPLNCPLVGMVARVAPAKDYDTLSEAAVEILAKLPETRFLIAGDHSAFHLNKRHYEYVSQKLKTLGIEDRFIFTGFREDVFRLVAAMDVCVLSTHREGFPLSVLEIMGLKKAMVATSVGGIPEVIIHGENGYLHKHLDSQELARLTVALLEDPEKTKQIGQAAYDHVRRVFSREQFVKGISKAYADVMAD